MSDLTLKCLDCGNQFVFTEAEQVYSNSKGIAPPSFCAICRGRRKAQDRDYQKWHPASK